MSSLNKSISPAEEGRRVKRNRKVASCNPCRARRSRCDRGKPCAACVARNDEDRCVWDSNALTPLFERREANETENLKSEVDRLQRLVDVLVSAAPPIDPFLPKLPTPPPAYALSASPAFAPPHDYPSSAPISHHSRSPLQSSSASRTASSSRLRALPEDAHEEIEAQDLVQKLSELTIKTFQLGAAGKGEVSSDPLVKEAQQLLDLQSAVDKDPKINLVPSPTSSTSTPLSLFSTSTTPTSTQELMQRVPSRSLVATSVEAYYTSVAWYVHPLPRSMYKQHEDVVFAAKDTNAAAPPISLAICFAVWALGLFASDGSAPAYSKYRKTDLAAALIELSKNALAIGRFLLEPSLDACRAMLLVSTHYAVLAPGEDGGCGVGLLALAVQSALQLELHRDPSKRCADLSTAEKEDRRRLFWLVHLADAELASTLGRRFTLLHSSDCDTKLPLDLDDDHLDQQNPLEPHHETLMTHLLVRMRLGQLTEKITREVFGIRPPTYGQILDFDIAIRALEAHILPQYELGKSTDALTYHKSLSLKILFLGELMRLHRPFLARAFVDPTYTYSRTVCVDCAQQILTLLKAPTFASVWSCLSYKSVAASVVLLLDLMYDSKNPAAEEWKDLAKSAIERLSVFSSVSTLCRRGTRLLRFLLQKIETSTPSFDEEGPLQKRTRPTLGSSHSYPQSSGPYADGSDDLEAKHKRPLVCSDHFAQAVNGDTGVDPSRPHLPLPNSLRNRRASSASSSSLFSTFSQTGTSSTPSFSTATSSPTFPPSSVRRQPSTLSTSTTYSAADEIANLDFPALLGIDGNVPQFSFDFGGAPPPPLPSSAVSSSLALEGNVSQPPVALPKGGAWSTFSSFDGVDDPSAFLVDSFSTVTASGGNRAMGALGGTADGWEGWRTDL